MARPPKSLLDPDRMRHGAAAGIADLAVKGREDKQSQDARHAVFKAKLKELYGVVYGDDRRGRARARKDHQRARDRWKTKAIYSSAGTGPEQLQGAIDVYIVPAATEDVGWEIESVLRRMIVSVRESRPAPDWALSGDEGRSLLRVIAENIPIEPERRAAYLGAVDRVCRDSWGDHRLWIDEYRAHGRR